MATITRDQYLQLLREAGLEGANDSGPEFKYGAKIVEKNGKKSLRGMTEDEYREAVHASTGKRLSGDMSEGYCTYGGGGQCVSYGCPGSCQIHGDINGFYCICVW